MKAFIAFALAIVVWAVSPFTSPAIAADLAQGAQVFASNCAACHIGGGNAIMAPKTLKTNALEQYLDGYGAEHDINAIIKQVTYGKNAMAAFGRRLSADEIANVAAYVQDQSEKGW
ncbi:MAG: c-type cytochrome [Phormidesmis sp.]